MIEIDITPLPAAEAVAESTGPLAYAVQAHSWAGRLPEDLGDLVAPPIVVSAAAVAMSTAPVAPGSPADVAAPARRRVDLLRYPMNMAMLAAAPPRSGRHRRALHTG